ncbi:hypothetical protein C1645_830918 [Glomus cerebriforme]|uniref:Uncharacterized protein n=1 Tax=Glomus cerebriforme TaxID=658196 RepID=A0A397SKD3_9GLOM|nr:hypothetical protein C1645_830918 [Glomus cerebriforme]
MSFGTDNINIILYCLIVPCGELHALPRVPFNTVHLKIHQVYPSEALMQLQDLISTFFNEQPEQTITILGKNPYENAFPVDINTNKVKTIGHFKKAIKEEFHLSLRMFSLTALGYGRSTFLSKKKTKNLISSTQKLMSILRGILVHSVETKEVHCTAMYGCKSMNFQWTVSQEMVSLEGFKKKLCEYFTFSDGTENEYIVIGHVVSGASLKRKISTGKMCKKLDLASSSSQSASDTIEIVTELVDTLQQTFSSYTFPKMKVLFSLKADSYDQLPCIEIGSSATPEEIRNSVIEDFLRMSPPSLV